METKIIGNRITACRKKLNLSQAQLAEQLFISAQAVGKWERGESMPDIVTLSRLAVIFKVDLNYFSGSVQDSASQAGNVVPQDKSSAGLPSGKSEDKLRWDMSEVNWMNADFSGLKNLQEKFSSCNMNGCKFIASELSGLILEGNHVVSCDFTGADISSSQILNTSLVKNTFKNSSLAGSEVSKSHIKGCDFSEADLKGVKFKSGGFSKNIIASTIWGHTTFKDIKIEDVSFEGTIDDCYFDNCSFKNVLFRGVTLTNTFFKCRSLKNIKFIGCYADRLTYEFLKNGKADLSDVTMLTA